MRQLNRQPQTAQPGISGSLVAKKCNIAAESAASGAHSSESSISNKSREVQIYRTPMSLHSAAFPFMSPSYSSDTRSSDTWQDAQAQEVSLSVDFPEAKSLLKAQIVEREQSQRMEDECKSMSSNSKGDNVKQNFPENAENPNNTPQEVDYETALQMAMDKANLYYSKYRDGVRMKIENRRKERTAVLKAQLLTLNNLLSSQAAELLDVYRDLDSETKRAKFE